MNQYILLDFDGTIADTYPVVKEFARKLEKKYSEEKINFDEIRIYGLSHLIKKSKVPFWRVPFIIMQIKKLLNSRIRSGVNIFPGMKTTISKLSKSHKLGLVSSNSLENIQIFLDRNGISQYFTIIHSDSSLFGKHAVIKKILDKHKIKTKQILYVGDENRDIEACRKLGIKVIAVSWGFNSKELLQKEKPDYLVEKPKELLKAVKKMHQ